ncbi:shikimate dehydrogenase family protein [Blattabacterium cuenoti]|uniref:shikimate dehydrogenase family protein n=1 Tax=Blattabacterium cuenoti TaxID=1653831 RepID=UPI00163C5A6E|nr:shikimate dehydrogenase [Blattabacterium cuenoti]
MKNNEFIKNKFIFGLIGRNIQYSFSREYFIKKFKKEFIKNCDYIIFDIPKIEDVISILNKPFLRGCNVTIPYKIKIFPFLDKIDKEARLIGSINVINIEKNKKIGYNTDILGFKKSFEKFIRIIKDYKYLKALILGTGGASKTVSYVLHKLDIKHKFVSRNSIEDNVLLYNEINKEILDEYKIIINCTPLGTHPNINCCPLIPYQYISNNHIFYDLIYNPSKTLFLKQGEKKGALIKNGLDMLYIQAEYSWKIWNS